MMSRSLISFNYDIIYTIYKQNIRKLYCYGGNQLAGHSKWANIKHIKALKDGQKSQIFAKLARQIRLAIQDGGSPYPTINSALQSAIDEAIKKNMPQATVRDIIKKQTSVGSLKLKKYILEMKMNKIFVVAIVYTDNLTQVKMNISTLLRKYRGIFSAVRHTFTEKGIIAATYDEAIKSELFDELCGELAINLDAEDYEIQDVENKCFFICSPDYLDRVKNSLISKKWSIDTSEHTFIPNIPITVSVNEINNFNSFETKLIEIEGVEEIYANLLT